MLAKEPERRPKDAAAVVAELDALAPVGVTTRSPASSATMKALGREEQRLVSIVLVGSPDAAVTREQHGSWSDATAIVSLAPDVQSAVEEAVASFAARLERLVGGSLVVLIGGGGVATDQAARAARCALALRRILGEAPMALATGRARLIELPVGEAIDRASRILRDANGTAAIRIDDTTAGLLDAHFDLGADDAGLVLRGLREVGDSSRTLLGKPTPFVGRERELAFHRGNRRRVHRGAHSHARSSSPARRASASRGCGSSSRRPSAFEEMTSPSRAGPRVCRPSLVRALAQAGGRRRHRVRARRSDERGVAAPTRSAADSPRGSALGRGSARCTTTKSSPRTSAVTSERAAHAGGRVPRRALWRAVPRRGSVQLAAARRIHPERCRCSIEPRERWPAPLEPESPLASRTSPRFVSFGACNCDARMTGPMGAPTRTVSVTGSPGPERTFGIDIKSEARCDPQLIVQTARTHVGRRFRRAIERESSRQATAAASSDTETSE